MLRSLYSGISGLKVHQTAMDVIGNNISNVNTIGFKASSTKFSDVLYQTSQGATAPNPVMGKAGTNPMSIGLGASVASISTDMAAQGGAQRTDNALDLMINGTAFFIVSQGGTNYFTKAGAFNKDGQGMLATEAGAYVMGWGVDPDNPNNILQTSVKPLKISTVDNMTSEPEGTSEVYFTGNVDQTDTALVKGRTLQMEFYDNLGNKYTAAYKLTQQDTVDKNVYDVELTDIKDDEGMSIFIEKIEENGQEKYIPKVPTPSIDLGQNTFTLSSVDEETGKVELSGVASTLTFNASTGKFVSIDDGNTSGNKIKLNINTGSVGDISAEKLFSEINVDFSAMTMYEDNGNSSITAERGDRELGVGAGKTKGAYKGVSVGTDGRIYAAYSNGDTKLLGQIAVAQFTNPSALEAIGNNMYKITQSSGDFDGIGKDISEIGLSFSTGVLEMSNVDISTEFTNMITTQRGFQANSRIITTSDTLLEELINLKR